MTITANLPDQLDVLRAENAMLEAENLQLRAALAKSVDDADRARNVAVALEQHIAEGVRRINEALDGEALAEFELADAIAFLAGEVTG